MGVSVTAVIPARLGSKRFSGKVLHSYRGKPLLFYIWSAVSRSRLINRLVIATDSRKIAEEAENFGAVQSDGGKVYLQRGPGRQLRADSSDAASK